MTELVNYVDRLPLELLVQVCNKCLSLCSDQSITSQMRKELPTTLFLPFLYRVQVVASYIECTSFAGSAVKILYEEPNFTKLLELLRNGSTIANLEIIDHDLIGSEVLNVLINNSITIKLGFPAYCYSFFFQEHENSYSKIFEVNLFNGQFLDIIKLLIDDNVKFLNLKRIKTVIYETDSIEYINDLFETIAENRLGNTHGISFTCYWEIKSVKDIIRYIIVINMIGKIKYGAIRYVPKISLFVNCIDTMLALKETCYIDFNDVVDLTVGIMSETGIRLVEEHLPFMRKLSSLTTYSKLDIVRLIKTRKLVNLKQLKDFSSQGKLPLSVINYEAMPRLQKLSLSIAQIPAENVIQLPPSLLTLHLTNYGMESANFTAIDFSNSSLKSLFVFVTGKHNAIQFKNLSSRLSKFEIYNIEDKYSETKKILIQKETSVNYLQSQFPCYQFSKTAG